MANEANNGWWEKTKNFFSFDNGNSLGDLNGLGSLFNNQYQINDANVAKWANDYGRNLANINGQLVDLDTDQIWTQDQINAAMQSSSMNPQDYLNLGSNIVNIATGIGSYLNGRKALKLAKDQFNMQRNAYLDNRNTQANLINQSLQDRLNTRYLQNTGSTNGANEEYERRKLSMLNSI